MEELAGLQPQDLDGVQSFFGRPGPPCGAIRFGLRLLIGNRQVE
jgi:hypothetical protein